MYGEWSISWLLRICSHEALKPCRTQQEISIDIRLISISCSVCELSKLEGVSSEYVHYIHVVWTIYM